MKIVVLVENTTKSDLKSEHGLSFFIEFQGKNYLLDAGTTELFLENARALTIPIENVNNCILSHGHYDHSGGFRRYLEENKKAFVYAMETAKEKYYSGSGELHYIGIPKEILEKQGDRFCYIKEVTKIKENVYLIPHATEELQKIGERAKLYVKKGEQYIPDDFSHELSLVFDTKKGLVIFNSCSHGGIQNIIKEVEQVFPKKQIYAFLGGLHMKGRKNGEEICTFSEEEIQQLVEQICEVGLQYLYTGHCTGQIAMQLLKKYAGDKVQELFTGQTILL